jgi:hypothetical protein
LKKNYAAKPVQKRSPLKSPTINILLDVSIFLLFAVIVYMVYSLYVKVSFKDEIPPEPGSEKGAEDIVQVEVLNGCGVTGVADRYTDYLRVKQFDVVKSSNYISSEMDETLVIDRIGNMANAFKVAKALGVSNKNVIQQLNKDYFIDVSIIIGKDYFSLSPFK